MHVILCISIDQFDNKDTLVMDKLLYNFMSFRLTEGWGGQFFEHI